MTDDLPVIDIGPLLRGDPEGLASVAAAIGRACRQTGFFYAINTPVRPELRAAVFAAAERFFACDTQAKQAVSITRSRHNRGYVALAGETLDPGTMPDLKEAFNIGLELAADDPDVVAGRPFRGPNLWPDLDGFRATLLAYYDAVLALGRTLHRAIAVDLGLSADHFADTLDRPLATLRLLHYPPRPAAPHPGQLGAGTHTDYGNLTLLATDAVGGLQVRRRDGRWIDAPVLPDAFVCNIGDCLMRWTNDTYISTPHRVVNPAGRERFSVAFFLDANPDAMVACLPGCETPAGQALYPPITAGDYLASRLDATYTHRGSGQTG